MLTGQSDVGIAVYNDRIYVTGGYRYVFGRTKSRYFSNSWNNRCMVDIVQCYDPAKDKWENRFELPEALGGIRACTLVLKHPSDYTVVNVEKEISMLEIGSNHG